jgi:hypothetical protein
MKTEAGGVCALDLSAMTPTIEQTAKMKKRILA